MAKSVGIDLGTTNSVVAVMEGGKPTVIPNSEGSRTTPSVVGFNKSGERVVGALARRQAVINPWNTAYSMKRFIGRRFAELKSEKDLVSYKVKEGPDGGCKIGLEKNDFTPVELSAMVLQKLKKDAEAYLGESVNEAVITVPAYFDDAQRQATKDAGTVAGLKVTRIINEPTAAALAYGLDKKKDETILVFDLGGGTFDVSILEVGDGVFEVKATAGDTFLGGDDFDHCVIKFIAEEFKKNEGIDLLSDQQALQRLTEASERAKIELSSVTETSISLPFITADSNGPKHLDTKLTRSKFDNFTAELVERCRKPIESAVSDAGISMSDIDEVVLVGGSTRIPAIQKLVKDLTGKEPNQSVNPDEVVAVGAAIQAGVLSGEVENIVLLDVTPLSLGLETMGGVFTRLVDRNTTIPTHKSQVFSTAEDNQPAVDIQIFQGERSMARDNKLLGNFRLDGISSAPRGIPQIEVSIDIDADGIVNVAAKDMNTGKQQKITITASSNLTKEDIERMVKEAEAHSNEDTKRKEQAEQRNLAESLCHLAEQKVKQHRDSLSETTLARAEMLIRDLRTSVNNGDASDSVEKQINDLKGALVMIDQEMAAKSQEATPHQSATPHGSKRNNNANDDVVDVEVA